MLALRRSFFFEFAFLKFRKFELADYELTLTGKSITLLLLVGRRRVRLVRLVQLAHTKNHRVYVSFWKWL